MKKILTFALVVVTALSLCACGAKLTSESCVGVWKLDVANSDANSFAVETMELLEGGIGKGTISQMTDGSYYPLVWEIKDNVLEVSLDMSQISYSFQLNEGTLSSTDGKIFYTK